MTLYLFLVTVSDAEGLSYYSDTKVGRLLNMDESSLGSARRDLRRAGLIAYHRPLYQVLSLDPPTAELTAVLPGSPRRGSDEAVSIGEVLSRALGGAA